MKSDILDATFFALADPTRRAILARLARGQASVAELAEPFTISQPAISKHLKILERAGLISASKDAQRHPRRLEGRPLAAASAWIEQYRAAWEASFERLERVLEDMQRTSAASHIQAERKTQNAKVRRKEGRRERCR